MNASPPKRRLSTTVFNEESNRVFESLRGIAKALTQAIAASMPAGLKENDTVFTLSRSLPEVTVAVRDAGERLTRLLGDFEQAIEDQLVTFYRTMKHQVEDEYEILRSTKSLMPSDPGLLTHLVTASRQELEKAKAALEASAGGNSGNGPLAVTPRSGAAKAAATSSTSPARRTNAGAHHSEIRGGGTGTATNVATTSTAGPAAAAAAPPATTSFGVSATEPLKTWLHLTLESAMQLCEASRGAIYLRASDESSAYLRRVHGINVEDRLPIDVSPAAGSTIATVVQNCVGVNIARSRSRNPDALKGYSSASQAVRSSVNIRINNGVIIPIGEVGCVVVADKLTESFFSENDEHVIWSAATLVRGVIRRYPLELFGGKGPSSSTVHTLIVAAMLPPIEAFNDDEFDDGGDLSSRKPLPPRHQHHQSKAQSNGTSSTSPNVSPRSGVSGAAAATAPTTATPSTTTPAAAACGDAAASSPQHAKKFLSPEEELQYLLPGITRIPRLPKKLVVVRASEYAGFEQILAKDIESLKKIELSDEDLLEAAVPYIANLEALWRKSIETMTDLRSKNDSMEQQLAAKNARIVGLEVEHRVLSRQLNNVRNDVQRIRSVVPAHLREMALGTQAPGSTTGGGATGGSTGSPQGAQQPPTLPLEPLHPQGSFSSVPRRGSKVAAVAASARVPQGPPREPTPPPPGLQRKATQPGLQSLR